MVVSSALVMGKTAIDAAQQQQTMVKIAVIKQALFTFSKVYSRLPCPASLALVTTSANFGTEGPKGANCLDGIAGNATATSNTAGNTVSEGAVPARTLGLSDDFAFDGWGNRIRYAVSVPFTTTAAFTTYAVNNTLAPAVKILDGTGASNYRTQGAMYALISAGSDRYGAYNKTGTLVTSTTTVHADEQQNCHCNSGGAAAYDGKYVQRATVTSSAANYYDDIVDYGMRWQMQTALDSPASGYTYYASITIDHTKVPNTDQTNFPMLFSGTYAGASGAPDLRVTGSGGAVTSSSGYDIIFATSNTCGTPLAFEQETYTAATGAVNYWVKIPALSHTTDTVIYLCYGNDAVTTSQATASAVWDTNYKGVWHMADNAASTTVTDTTANNNGANAANTSAKTTTGKIGRALSYNGASDNALIANQNYFSPAVNNMTISFWAMVPVGAAAVNAACDAATAVKFLNKSSGSNYEWWFTNSNNTSVCFHGSVKTGASDLFNLSKSFSVNDGAWHYYTALVQASATSASFYVDGVLAASTASYIGGNGFSTSTSQVKIALNDNNARFANVNIDEVKISSTARSADWISTEYNNQSLPDKSGGAGGFYTVGSAVAL